VGVSGALLLAYQILFIGVDIRIAVIYGRGITVLYHPLDDGSAAWRTACM
jgi:hypothetical protein